MRQQARLVRRIVVSIGFTYRRLKNPFGLYIALQHRASVGCVQQTRSPRWLCEANANTVNANKANAKKANANKANANKAFASSNVAGFSISAAASVIATLCLPPSESKTFCTAAADNC